ncbi:MAG: HEAT repeat domain-containing protein [Planctomycetes bacterium]|nr:HEAT repeat domain-containing protein [Planctomycetota bacterium]
MQVVKVALAMAAGGLLGCGMRPDPASTEGDLQAAFERREFGSAVRSTDGVDLARVTALHEWADTDPARLADVIRWLAADAPTPVVESSIAWLLLSQSDPSHEADVRAALSRPTTEAVAVATRETVAALRTGAADRIAHFARCLTRLPIRSLPMAVVEAMTLAELGHHTQVILDLELRDGLRLLASNDALMSELVGLASRKLDSADCSALGRTLALAVGASRPVMKLMEQLSLGDERSRSIVAGWVGPRALDSHEALAIAERLAADPAAALRRTLAGALYSAGRCSPSIEAVLLGLCGDADERVRATAASSLGVARCATDRVETTLRRLVGDDPSPRVRIAALASAVSSLGDRDRAGVRATLRKALADPATHVRAAAVELCVDEGMHDRAILAAWVGVAAQSPIDDTPSRVAVALRGRAVDVTDEVVGLLNAEPGVSRSGVLRVLDALKTRRPDLRTEFAAELASADEEVSRLARSVTSPP